MLLGDVLPQQLLTYPRGERRLTLPTEPVSCFLGGALALGGGAIACKDEETVP